MLATHGSLTPLSVFVRSLTPRECELAVGDFGLLPLLFEPSWSPPKVGDVAWFPIAPETDGASKRVTPATDVFATAMIVAEMISVVPARAAIWAAIVHDPRTLPAVIERLRPGLHASVREALVSALLPDPARRPRDADRLARALRDATWEESIIVTPERPSVAPTPLASATQAQLSTPNRARISEAWSAPVAPPVAPRENVPAAPVTPRIRAMTEPIERSFGAPGPTHAEPHTLTTGTIVPLSADNGENTIQEAPSVAIARLFAEPDTELVVVPSTPPADGERTQPLPSGFAIQERTESLPEVPMPPVAVARGTAADERTIGIEVSHATFGNGAPIPLYAQGDSGTMVALPEAAAAWIHVAEQRRTNPVPDFQETAPLGANAIKAALAASKPATVAPKVALRASQSRPQPPPAPTERPMPTWVPWAVLGAAALLAAVVFFALTRG